MTAQFKTGDRVRVVAAPDRDHATLFRDRSGVITRPFNWGFDSSNKNQAWSVRFDNSAEVVAFFEQDLQLEPVVTIEEALAVLRAAGTVTFVKNKPPFMTVSVKVGTHQGFVDDKEITVGCQKVSFRQFDLVAEAVAKARAYAKEAA